MYVVVITTINENLLSHDVLPSLSRVPSWPACSVQPKPRCTQTELDIPTGLKTSEILHNKLDLCIAIN